MADRPTAGRRLSTAKMGRRVGWTIVDQGLSSVTNFLLGVLVARSVEPVVFGAFSLCFVTYRLALGLFRGLVAQPIMMRLSAENEEQLRRGTRDGLGASLAVGIAAGLLISAVATLTSPPLRTALWALSATMPLLLLQDGIRFVFFAQRRSRSATLNDALWGVTQLTLMALLIHLDRAGAASLIAAWGMSAGVATFVGLRQLRLVPDPRQLRPWLATHRDISIPLSLEFVLISGGAQLTYYALGFVASLTEVASLRAAQVLIGPVNVLFTAGGLVLVAEGVRIGAKSISMLRKGIFAIASVMGVAGAVWGVVLVLLPNSAGRALLADNWETARDLLVILGIAAAGRGVTAATRGGLRALGEARDILSSRAIIAPISVVAGLTGATFFGAVGAASAFALTEVLSGALYARAFHRASTAQLDVERTGRAVDKAVSAPWET